MTPEILAGIAGAILSLAFSYIPKLNVWFAALSDETKRLIMAGVLALVAVGVYVGQCFLGLWDYGFTCDKAGIFQLVGIYIAAIVANQGVHRITPKTKAVKLVLGEY